MGQFENKKRIDESVLKSGLNENDLAEAGRRYGIKPARLKGLAFIETYEGDLAQDIGRVSGVRDSRKWDFATQSSLVRSRALHPYG